MADHKKLTEDLQYDIHIQFPAMRHSGGIIIMWKENILQVDEVLITSQGIHAMVKVLPSNLSWLFSAIYASNYLEDRKTIWKNLINISNSINDSWFVGGDFNEVLKAKDKFGGNYINTNISNLFWNCINQCRIVDLGYKGSKYTWSNKRYKNKTSLILERIDGCFVNNCWINEFPEAFVTHLARTHSDYCPLLVKLNNNTQVVNVKPFWFESMWCSHPTFHTLIRDSFPTHSTLIPSSLRFKNNVINWNKHNFNNIFHKKKRLLARIAGIQKSPNYQFSHFLLNLENTLIEELDSILKNEEDF
ncbi:uncharacterized protein LOC142167164 [Nicotiana tabacum]|uniref:Uncharacterized protein LOC142167164 n=1 Tax=Nicotiana tabacum TaxID=4097 RepID=A0AC58SEN0_TOBAC